MNCDELLMCEPEIPDTESLLTKKERLYALAACQKTKQYLGTEFTIEQIQNMSPQDIVKYHSRYEAQLGSRIVRSVGRSIIGLYVKLIRRFAPIDSEQDFTYDLSQDPILTKSLECLSCDLYYRFGSLLTPLTMGLITFNHLNFNFNFLKNEHRESTGESTGESTDRNTDRYTDEQGSPEGNEEPR